jgi:hypothetical protein
MHDFGRIAPREREVMSGEKISVVVARACGRSSIPETPMMEPRGRDVLVTPHARGMTPVRARVHLTTLLPRSDKMPLDRAAALR